VGKVVITGYGMITSIGMDNREVLSSLLSRKSGIGRITHINSVFKGDIPVAEVKATDAGLRDIARLSKKEPYSRTSLLGIIAAREAIRMAESDLPGKRTGLISATTVGGMDRSEKFCREFFRDNSRGRLRDIITHDIGDSTRKIADDTGIKDFITTISTACSSSANAILLAARLISNGILDRVVAGGTDALTLFTINGFNSLCILDRESCMPFDENRNGLTLGEGAAYLVLESEEVAIRENRKYFGVVSGYGNACDAFHQTASSPEGEGAFLSMQKALKKAGLEPGKINYINVHGTGTRNNDLSEGRAIERIFAPNVPRFSSTKSYTGHTLGAAGAIEAVFSIMAIRHSKIWPDLRFMTRMSELSISPETSIIHDIPVNNVLSNSFGFGGNNTSLIFSAS
jgi:3-oxoacyl-(acyl-carrier-protein) synthase